MGKPEATIQRKIQDYLKTVPEAYFFKVSQGRHTVVGGISDLIGLFKGKFYAIEVKTPTGRMTELQKTFFSRVESSGGVTICARSVDDVKQHIL